MSTRRERAMAVARKIEPLIRIALYTLAGSVFTGLPPSAFQVITTDPAMAELAVQIVGVLIFAASMIWWRIAKWLGRET